MLAPLVQDGTYDIIGAAMRVHRELGPGFLEAVYEEALEYELLEMGRRLDRQCPFTITYRGKRLRKRYIADLIVDGRVILELKAKCQLHVADLAQARNYLRASGLPVALVLNFGAPSLELRRVT